MLVSVASAWRSRTNRKNPGRLFRGSEQALVFGTKTFSKLATHLAPRSRTRNLFGLSSSARAADRLGVAAAAEGGSYHAVPPEKAVSGRLIPRSATVT
jgi:hypothetical protein